MDAFDWKKYAEKTEANEYQLRLALNRVRCFAMTDRGHRCTRMSWASVDQRPVCTTHLRHLAFRYVDSPKMKEPR